MEINKSITPSATNVRVVDAWYLYKNISELYWGATATTAGFGVARGLYAGNWSTLKTAHKMLSFGLRAHWNTVRAVFNTRLVNQAGSRTLGQALKVGTASLAAAYTLGSVTGIAIADIFFDEKELAAELYLPGGPSFVDDALLAMPRNLEEILNHYLV